MRALGRVDAVANIEGVKPRRQRLRPAPPGGARVGFHGAGSLRPRQTVAVRFRLSLKVCQQGVDGR